MILFGAWTQKFCNMSPKGHVCSACSVGVLLLKAVALKIYYLVSYL